MTRSTSTKRSAQPTFAPVTLSEDRGMRYQIGRAHV